MVDFDTECMIMIYCRISLSYDYHTNIQNIYTRIIGKKWDFSTFCRCFFYARSILRNTPRLKVIPQRSQAKKKISDDSNCSDSESLAPIKCPNSHPINNFLATFFILRIENFWMRALGLLFCSDGK